MPELRYIAACRCQAWHLMIGPGALEDMKPVPYRCHSWRHEGPCRESKAMQDWSRVRDAVLSRDCWTYMVVTFRQSEWWDWKEQYTQSYPMWSKLRLRLRREIGKFEYIQTWERHKQQGIHVNLMIASEELHSRDWKHDADKRHFWLSPNAEDCGFGPVCWIERFRKGTEGQIASYLTNMANELVGAGKKNQIPYDAPPHFRRLRASPKLLPPISRSGMTGWLNFTPIPEVDVVKPAEQARKDDP